MTLSRLTQCLRLLSLAFSSSSESIAYSFLLHCDSIQLSIFRGTKHNFSTFYTSYTQYMGKGKWHFTNGRSSAAASAVVVMFVNTHVLWVFVLRSPMISPSNSQANTNKQTQVHFNSNLLELSKPNTQIWLTQRQKIKIHVVRSYM